MKNKFESGVKKNTIDMVPSGMVEKIRIKY